VLPNPAKAKCCTRTIRIGSGTFEIDEAQDESQLAPCYLHIYVPDADACYEEAVRAGAIFFGAAQLEALR